MSKRQTRKQAGQKIDCVWLVASPGEALGQLGGLFRSSSFNCFLFSIQIYFLPCEAFKKQQPHKGTNLPAAAGLQSPARACLPPALLKLGSNKELSIMLLLFKTIPDNGTLIRLEQRCQKVSQRWLSQKD